MSGNTNANAANPGGNVNGNATNPNVTNANVPTSGTNTAPSGIGTGSTMANSQSESI